MTRRRSAWGLASVGVVLLLTAYSCPATVQQPVEQRRALASINDTLRMTAPFIGDTASDSALYDYGRNQLYRLMTDSGSVRTDSAGFRGSIDLCTEEGSVNIPASDLPDGAWRAVGCVIRSGPVSADFPYLESGLSMILVRRASGNWQARLLGMTTSQTVRMFVSTTSLVTTNPEARRFIRSGRPYLCYTCDRKACCPQPPGSVTNPGQAQSDVNAIALSW